MMRLVIANNSLRVAERGQTSISRLVFVRRDQECSASVSGVSGNGWLSRVMRSPAGV